MPTSLSDAREVSALVAMPRLLETLGFEANERTRRCACILHGGSNRSAFSWTEAGIWRCHSCGAGGDRISLVKAARRCSFPEAVAFLAALAGVEYRSRRVSRGEIAHARWRKEKAEHGAWRIADEIGRLRRYYTDAMQRTERLQRRIGSELLRLHTEAARESEWEQLARLASVCRFFFVAWNFIWDAKPGSLVRFALASSTARRRSILEGDAA